MVDQGLAESRNQAQRMIMAGQVRADGELVHKPSQLVLRSSRLEVAAFPRFVSRGGDKLDAALQAFALDVGELVCADVGASTGGFTDCLLQHGARKVYALDVGQGQLHWRLRNDARVVILEGVNARKPLDLPEQVDLVTVDVSFISLRHILQNIVRWLKPAGDLIALIKPQFEAGRDQVGKGGVIKDPAVHREVVSGMLAAAASAGLAPQDVVISPLRGPKGNIEFFVHCKVGGLPVDAGGLLIKLGLA